MFWWAWVSIYIVLLLEPLFSLWTSHTSTSLPNTLSNVDVDVALLYSSFWLLLFLGIFKVCMRVCQVFPTCSCICARVCVPLLTAYPTLPLHPSVFLCPPCRVSPFPLYPVLLTAAPCFSSHSFYRSPCHHLPSLSLTSEKGEGCRERIT